MPLFCLLLCITVRKPHTNCNAFSTTFSLSNSNYNYSYETKFESLRTYSWLALGHVKFHHLHGQLLSYIYHPQNCHLLKLKTTETTDEAYPYHTVIAKHRFLDGWLVVLVAESGKKGFEEWWSCYTLISLAQCGITGMMPKCASKKYFNSLVPNDAIRRHELPSAHKNLYGGFNTRRYTIVHGFCFFKLFLMGCKELKCQTFCMQPYNFQAFKVLPPSWLDSRAPVGSRVTPWPSESDKSVDTLKILRILVWCFLTISRSNAILIRWWGWVSCMYRYASLALTLNQTQCTIRLPTHCNAFSTTFPYNYAKAWKLTVTVVSFCWHWVTWGFTIHRAGTFWSWKWQRLTDGISILHYTTVIAKHVGF